MSGVAGCPECGAEVKFTKPGAVLSICSHCSSVVAKRGLEYAKLGKVAQLADTGSALAIGLRGGAHGGFEIVGRLQYDHGAGTWNEWYLATDAGRFLWLAEAQGRFFLQAPVGKVAQAPAFDKLHPGHSIHLPLPDGTAPKAGDTTLRVAEVHTAKLVSAEGQIPFEFELGKPMRYADLSGAKGRVGTLDYGAPGDSEIVGYYGRQLRLDELKLDRSSFTPTPKAAKAGKRMSCPSCDGALELKAPDLSERVTCPYCRALVDCTKEPLVALATLKKLSADLAPRFALGSQATLRGHNFTVLGHVQRQITSGDGGHWDEYLLWTGAADVDSAFYYLVDSGNHFTLVEPIPYGDVGGGERHRYARGYFCTLAEQCTTRVVHINGEFSWAVELGETVDVKDYAADGVLISLETSKGERKEINASLGLYLDSDEVWAAFKLEGKPPAKTWVAPHQPNPYRAKWERQKPVLGYATLAMLGVLAFSCARSGHYARSWDVNTVAGVEPGAEHILISDPFELAKSGSQVAVEVSLKTAVDNSWLASDVSLINEETGEAHTVGLEAAYYSGYSDGESWSEGSRTASAIIPQVPGGKYVIRIEPSWPVQQGCTISSDCGSIIGWSCIAGKCVRGCGPPQTRVVRMTTKGDGDLIPQTHIETLNRNLAALTNPGLPSTSYGTCPTGRECINSQCVLPPAVMKLRISHPTTRWAYAMWLWLFMALVPVWNWLAKNRFEQRRTEDNS